MTCLCTASVWSPTINLDCSILINQEPFLIPDRFSRASPGVAGCSIIWAISNQGGASL